MLYIRITKLLVQTSLSAWLCLGTETCYKGSFDLRIEIRKYVVINSGRSFLSNSGQTWPYGSQAADKKKLSDNNI